MVAILVPQAEKNSVVGDDAVVVGGVIPQQDYAELFAAGATAIFGPGTPIPQAAEEILRVLKNDFSA